MTETTHETIRAGFTTAAAGFFSDYAKPYRPVLDGVFWPVQDTVWDIDLDIRDTVGREVDQP